MSGSQIHKQDSRIPLSFEKAVKKFGLLKLAKKLNVALEGEDSLPFEQPTPPPPPVNVAAAAEYLKFKRRIVNFNPRDYFVTEEITESVWQGPKLIEKKTYEETLQSKYRWELIYDREREKVIKETIPIRIKRFYTDKEVEEYKLLEEIVRDLSKESLENPEGEKNESGLDGSYTCETIYTSLSSEEDQSLPGNGIFQYGDFKDESETVQESLPKKPPDSKVEGSSPNDELASNLNDKKLTECEGERVVGRAEAGIENLLIPSSSSSSSKKSESTEDDLPSCPSTSTGIWNEEEGDKKCLTLLNSTEDVVKDVVESDTSVSNLSNIFKVDFPPTTSTVVKGIIDHEEKDGEADSSSEDATTSSTEVIESDEEPFDEALLLENEGMEEEEPACKPIDGKKKEKKKDEEEVSLNFSVSRLSVDVGASSIDLVVTQDEPMPQEVENTPEESDVNVVMMVSSKVLDRALKKQGETTESAVDLGFLRATQVASSINIQRTIESDVHVFELDNDDDSDSESDPIVRKGIKWEKESKNILMHTKHSNLTMLASKQDKHSEENFDEESDSKVLFLDEKWKEILEKELETWDDSESQQVQAVKSDDSDVIYYSQSVSFNYILAPVEDIRDESKLEFQMIPPRTVSIKIPSETEVINEVFPGDQALSEEAQAEEVLDEEGEKLLDEDKQEEEQSQKEASEHEEEEEVEFNADFSSTAKGAGTLADLQREGVEQLIKFREERSERIAKRKEKKRKFDIMQADAQYLLEYEKVHPLDEGIVYAENMLKCTFLELRPYKKKVHAKKKLKRYEFENIRAKNAYHYYCETSDAPLVEAVNHNLNGRVINLELYGIRPGSIQTITESMKRSKTVNCFNLRKNRLTPLDCYHVGQMLKEHYYIRYLNLSFCGLNHESMEYLIPGISESRTLEVLDLSDNQLGDKGVIPLTEILIPHTTLKKINLSGNKITNASAIAISELFYTNRVINDFNLSKNNLDGARELKNMMTHATVTKALRKLDLSWNGMDQKAILDAIRGFCSAKSLTHLNLSYNEFSGADAADGFNKILSKAATLEYLDISYNNIPPQETPTILAGLSENCPVKYLKMKNTYVNQEFVSSLRNLHNRGGMLRVWFSGIAGNFDKPVVDMKPILLRRLNFCGNKPKKKKDKRDFGKILLKLQEEGKLEPMKKDQFIQYMMNLNFPNLDDGLPEDLGKLFFNASRLVDLQAILDAYLTLYPDTHLDPPPQPKKKKAADGEEGEGGKKKKKK